MVKIMYFCTLTLLGICSLTGKNRHDKKHMQFCTLLAGICIVLMVSANRTGNDILNYFRSYNRTVTFDREPLYQFLILTGNKLGLTFYEFRALVSLMGYLLIYFSLARYVNNMPYILFFYCIHLLFMDSMQLRNFLAISIVIYAFRFLYEKNKHGSMVAYIVCVLTAMGIHTGFIFYFLLLLMLIRNRKTFAKALFAVGLLLILITFLNSNRIPFVSEIAAILMGNEKRAQNYFSGVTHWGFLIPASLYFVGFGGVLLAKKQSGNWLINQQQIKYVSLVAMINMCFVVAVPLIMMNVTFYRLVRNLLYFNLGVYANAYSVQKKKSRRIGIFIFTLCLCLGWAYFDFLIYACPEWMIEPIWEGEWFWSN